MLKMMSSAIENYDTQMVDYMVDIDMQMQAFSSDHWLHDEAKMEEDSPGLKPENVVHLKADGQERGDPTIEIDMEEHISAEYDMVDDDEQFNHASAAELLDVEVLDASLAHSPAMVPLDSAPTTETAFSASIAVSPKQRVTILPAVPETSSSTEILPSPVIQETFSSLQEGLLAVVSPETHEDVSHTDKIPVSATSQDRAFDHPENVPSQEPKQTFETDNLSEDANLGIQEKRSDEECQDPARSKPSGETDTSVAADEGLRLGEVVNPEHVDEITLQVESTSSGDPHEISEGVYIDPPPPVLVSIASEDHEAAYCFFNEPVEWQSSRLDQDQEARRTILHHLPTLYYESLFTLFEALRQDEFIQSVFQLHDAELVLQVIDLALTITEDNVYAREVSLHDLNVLHDVSGIPGPLRTRLCTSSPRFIVRYQQLQENVSRLQLEQASREISIRIQAEVHNQRLHSVEGSDHQEHYEESRRHPHATDGEESEVNDEEGLSISAKPEPPVPPQSSPEENYSNTVAEVIQLPYEEEEEISLVAGSEGDNLLSQDSAGAEEPASDLGSRHDRNRSADEHPTSQDEGQGANSAIGESDAAVIVLEEVEGSEQGAGDDDDQSDHITDHRHDDEQDEQEYADDTQDSEEYVDNTPHVHAAGSAADEEEASYEPALDGDEQDQSHQDLEYENAEDNLGPGHLQAFEEPANQQGKNTEVVEKTDNTSYSNDEIEAQDYAGEGLPDLPTDPISFDDESWELGFGDESNVDASWNDGDDNDHSVSNHSSVTLSSRASKRTYDEYESDGAGGYDDDDGQHWQPSGSPGAKRSRID